MANEMANGDANITPDILGGPPVLLLLDLFKYPRYPWWSSCSPPSGICSNIILSVRPTFTTLHKAVCRKHSTLALILL